MTTFGPVPVEHKDTSEPSYGEIKARNEAETKAATKETPKPAKK